MKKLIERIKRWFGIYPEPVPEPTDPKDIELREIQKKIAKNFPDDIYNPIDRSKL